MLKKIAIALIVLQSINGESVHCMEQFLATEHKIIAELVSEKPELKKIKELVEDGVSVKSIVPGTNGPLYYAIKKTAVSPEIVSYLMEKGAEFGPYLDGNALEFLVEEMKNKVDGEKVYFDKLKIVAEKWPNKEDLSKALFIAAHFNRDFKTLDLLINEGADLKYINKEGSSLLAEHEGAQNKEMKFFLMARGVPLNIGYSYYNRHSKSKCDLVNSCLRSRIESLSTTFFKERKKLILIGHFKKQKDKKNVSYFQWLPIEIFKLIFLKLGPHQLCVEKTASKLSKMSIEHLEKELCSYVEVEGREEFLETKKIIFSSQTKISEYSEWLIKQILEKQEIFKKNGCTIHPDTGYKY